MTSEELREHLVRIEGKVDALLECWTVHDWYTTKQFAGRVERSEGQVTEWCRRKRINAEKVKSGGPQGSWRISHGELQRYRREGLLPEH